MSNNKKEKNCIVCNKTFNPAPRQKICSEDCKKIRANKRSTEYHKRAKTGKTDAYKRKLEYIKKYNKENKTWNKLDRKEYFRIFWNKKQYGEMWEVMLLKEKIHKICVKRIKEQES